MRRAVLCLIPVLVLAACGEGTTSSPIALIELFEDGSLEGALAPQTVEPTIWQAGSESTLALGPSFGWASAEPGDAAWSGTSGSDKPIIAWASSEPLGGDDELYAVEIRMRTTAGKQLALTTLGEEGPPAPAFSAPDGPPLVLLTDLLPGEEMQTYRIDMTRSFPMGPFTRRGIRRVVLQPTDEVGAEVEVESVRLIFRREHFASLPSGIGWHGLGNIFRETLITRSGETARFGLEVPADAWLDLAVGTLERQPVTFTVAVERADGATTPLLERTVTTPERWENDPADLSAFAGEQVTLKLRASSPVEGALAFWGHPTLRPRGAGAAAADSTVPQGVILILADTLRADHLSTYGYDRETAPVLTQLAAEGARFDNAIAQGTWTKISVPAILTSLHPSSHGIVEFVDRLPAGVTTMAEAFRQAGYATLQTSSVPFSGQLTNLQQGVEVLHESSSVKEEPSGKTGRLFTDRLLDWVEGHRDVPFFAMIHAMDPHSPYEPAAPYNGWWTEPGASAQHKADEEAVSPFIDAELFKHMTMPTREDLVEAGIDPETYVTREIGWYDGSIRAFDSEVGRIISRLRHLGLEDRVVVAFFSDHGEELLDHGQHWHGTTVYAEQTDVPLVLWGPGFVPGGVVAPQTVQMIDLMPTLLDLAGLATPEEAQGQSLLPLITSLAAGEEASAGGWQQRPAFSESSRGPGFARILPQSPNGRDVIVDGQWRLVENLEPPADWPQYELYDRANDPLDQNDLAADKPDVVAELAAKLMAWREWTQARRLEPDSLDSMSAEELARLKSLGYI